MSARRHFNWIDGGFVLLLGAACATLSVLQYRWTGEMARAETERMRDNLADQSKLLCRAFDAEIAASCRQFFLTRTELDEPGRDAACLERLREWQEGNPRPIFRRIAVATFYEDSEKLVALKSDASQPVPMEWPPEWAALKEHYDHTCSRGRMFSSFSFSDPKGTLFDFYMPSSRDRPDLPRHEWIIFELDMDYVKNRLLPEMVHAYIDPDGRGFNDVEIRTLETPHTTIFTTRIPGGGPAVSPFVMHLNRETRSSSSSSGGDLRTFSGTGRWALEAWQRLGTLEAVVNGLRRRNFGVALMVNGLMLAAGLALLHHARRSRQLAEAQMNFVANVSHELRTPLTVISGAAQNLRRGIVNEPERLEQYSGLIAQSADRLGELIEQVLAFATVKNGQVFRQPTSVSLAEVLHDARETAASETQAAGCEIQVDLPPSLPEVSGDAADLRRVFHNLIANAAKHGGDGGWIGITAAPSNGSRAAMVEVRVADRGPGIPEGERAEIFKPFFRGARAQERQIRGSGLGLSLAREIVEACGGTISVSSTPGGGATFSVLLPVAKSAEET